MFAFVAMSIAFVTEELLPRHQCAAMSAALLLRLHGSQCDLADIARDFQDAQGLGTSGEIIHALRKRSIMASSFRMEWKHDLRIRGPSIIRTRIPRSDVAHYQVLLPRRDGGYSLVDPMLDDAVELTPKMAEWIEQHYLGDVICSYNALPLDLRAPWIVAALNAVATGLLALTVIEAGVEVRKTYWKR